MKTILFCVVSIVTLIFAGSIHAQGFGGSVVMKSLDVNGDGELSAEEIANAASVLAFLDDNADGMISKSELRSGQSFWDMDDYDWGDFDDWGDYDDMDMGDMSMDDMSMGDMNMDDSNGGRGRESKPNKGNVLKPEDVEFKNGTSTIPDRETFKKLSAPGEEILGKPGVKYVKFQIEDPDTENPRLYFINTNTHPAHTMFMSAIGKRRGPWGMRGALVYYPFAMAPSGKPGLYTFAFEMQDTFPFEMVKRAHDLLSEKSALLKDHLAYDPLSRGRKQYNEEKDKFEAAGLPVFLSEDKYANIGYLPLNPVTSFGQLRLMDSHERPSARDIVIYSTLPNEMPRVAGVITMVRQTPLSHVNLRAIQDNIPNAFIAGVENNQEIAALIGKYVSYTVTAEGYELREATIEEVNAHFAAIRPQQPQFPPRDLSVTKIHSLDQIGFDDSTSVGVKAANLATLHTFGFPEGVIPEGFAVPFYFYDEFMKHNGFYKAIADLRADPDFQQDTEKRKKALKEFRKQVKQGEMPPWMMDAIGQLQASFPVDSSIRCRSSTNNEDLAGFSGAGLYSSYTHHPDEGHLAKSIMQVYASLWNFRAYEEREFFRIDHETAAMGVLLHLNFKDERANGVAVTEDIVYQTPKQQGRTYYINAQVGEDMVTNPEGESIPEEILLSPRFIVDDVLVRRSNRTESQERVLSADHMNELRLYLKTIHREFAALYGKTDDSPFAMEIEFKITSDGKLVIKQARPWVY